MRQSISVQICSFTLNLFSLCRIWDQASLIRYFILQHPRLVNEHVFPVKKKYIYIKRTIYHFTLNYVQDYYLAKNGYDNGYHFQDSIIFERFK